MGSRKRSGDRKPRGCVVLTTLYGEVGVVGSLGSNIELTVRELERWCVRFRGEVGDRGGVSEGRLAERSRRDGPQDVGRKSSSPQSFVTSHQNEYMELINTASSLRICFESAL